MEEVPNFYVKIKVENDQHHREYPVAYYPIPKGVITEEPLAEEGSGECEFLAYSPESVLKEEPESRDGHDDFHTYDQNVFNAAPVAENDGFLQIVPGSVISLAKSTPETVELLKLADITDAGSNMHHQENCGHQDNFFLDHEDGMKRGTQRTQTRKIKRTSSKNKETDASLEAGKSADKHSAEKGIDSLDDDSMLITSFSSSQSKQNAAEKALSKANRSEETERGRLYKRKHHLKEAFGDQIPCTECGHQFKTKATLRKHLIKIHQIDRSQLEAFGIVPKTRSTLPFKCDKCSRSYKYKASLTNHLKYECEVEPTFSCILCDHRSMRKTDLRKHLISIHNVDRSQFAAFGSAALSIRPVLPFKCQKCGRTYKTKEVLQKHLKFVCGVDPSFTCSKCDYRTKKKTNLNRHLKYVHGEGTSQI